MTVSTLNYEAFIESSISMTPSTILVASATTASAENASVYGGSGCGCGTVFVISARGAEKMLYSFTGACGSGSNPEASLIDVNGTLCGTTTRGVTVSCDTRGTIYSITPVDVEQMLHEFIGGSDRADPQAGLIDVKGVFYGTTEYGGLGPHSRFGTVFALTP